MNVRVDTTPDSRSDVCTLLEERLENGWSINRACDYVGVSVSMYYGWKDAARRGDDEAILLLRRLKRARAKGLDKRIGPIEAASEEDWRAAAWLVTKQDPDLLSGQVEEIEVPEPDDTEQRIAREYLSPERLQVLADGYIELGVVPSMQPAEFEAFRPYLDRAREKLGRADGSAPVRREQTEAQKQAAKGDQVMRALWAACAPFTDDDDEGLDSEMAIGIVKAVVPGTFAVDVKQAAVSLGLEEKDHIGIGSPSRKTWKVVAPPPWVEQDEPTPGQLAPEPEQGRETIPVVSPFGQGTGDAIDRGRRRA
jgi:hypothetical protein